MSHCLSPSINQAKTLIMMNIEMMICCSKISNGSVKIMMNEKFVNMKYCFSGDCCTYKMICFVFYCCLSFKKFSKLFLRLMIVKCFNGYVGYKFLFLYLLHTCLHCELAFLLRYQC